MILSSCTLLGKRSITSKQQLENLKEKIGTYPQLEQNERLKNNPLGFFNEWTVLSYSLTVLGDLMRENIDLRKKLEDLVDKYVLTPLSPKPPYSHPLYPPDMRVLTNHKLEFLDKRFGKLEEIMKEKLGA
ncbi:hypothetical protein ACJRO7_015865 [Eucalyptus globulus]|uniref:Uncharacterized protein n=1 Tax=Eucalyptus globulus TaxID=34317 RepID=A0ABD3LAY4_EUCGL